MRMCGDLFSLNYGREVVCLSLSLSLFVPVLCGVEDFCFARVVVSSPKSVGKVVSLFYRFFTPD